MKRYKKDRTCSSLELDPARFKVGPHWHWFASNSSIDRYAHYVFCSDFFLQFYGLRTSPKNWDKDKKKTPAAGYKIPSPMNMTRIRPKCVACF